MIHLLWLSLAIPILIHLVHRRKAKPMPFSTLRFLQMVDQRVARRQRLRELLLFALRLLLLAALIGAIERPMLRSATFKGTAVPKAVVIVLDDTASMGAATQGSSAFAEAQSAALQILDGLKGEDSAALVPFDAADEAPAPPTTALPELRARIAKMECGYGTAELSAPLRRALRSLELSSNAAKEVYVITDMQKLCWTDALSSVAAEFPRDVPLFVVDVGGDVTENLAVRDVDFGVKANVVGTAATCYCRIENTGSQSLVRKASLFIEGRKCGEQPATVSAGAAQTVTFRHVFEQAGLFGGWVELDPDDYAADNRRYFTVQVVDKLPVLVINGAPSAIPYRDGAFFLRLALQGGADAGGKLSPIETRVVADADAASQRLEDYRCVVLTNVPRVEGVLAERLKDYVQAGGGLLIFCGDKVDPAAYNVALGAAPALGVGDRGDSAGRSLLPAALGALKSSSEIVPRGSGGKEEAFFRIQRFDTSHAVFRDIVSDTDPAATRVRSLFRVEGWKEAGGSVLAETDGGPLFLEKKLGAGAVILCTSTCTPAWNNLPLKPHFVPVVHQIVYYLSRAGGASSSTPAGTPYHLKLPKTAAPVLVSFHLPLPPGGAPSDPNLRKPSLAVEVKSSETGGENRATLLDTGRPGVYRAEFNIPRSGPQSSAEGGNIQPVLFAVNVPVEESNLARLPLEEVRDHLDVRNLVLVRDPARNLVSAMRTERQGVPLWDYLLLATLALAVCESFVGNVFLKH